MSFPLEAFLKRAFEVVLRQSGEDNAYARIVLYDGVYESIISVDPHSQEHNLLVAANIHHEGNTIKQSFHFGGGHDLEMITHGIQADFERVGITINSAELYKWKNHRDHDHHVKRVEKVLDKEWRTDLTDAQTADLRDRDVLNNYIASLTGKLLPWWRPVSEGHVEANWSTGCNEETVSSFAAWVILVAPQSTLDFFAHHGINEIGREVNNNFDKYTNADRFLHHHDPNANLYASLKAFRQRNMPVIEAN